MLPLFLSLTGLYSYQKKQIIDFKELTDAGLFGIFGAVGSGKSSILEAIGFVLYEDTERLNKAEKRSYNMLNLKSDTVNIEFEFLNFEDRKFKFVANWKRKRKFEDTTPIERLAYEWIDNDWIPLESNDATPIIGLTYENFRRTIIIPQGKFKEFLDLKGKDRSDMMKEIFHLDQFDLSSKVGNLQSSTKSKLDELRGALSRYEDTTQEKIVVLEEELALAEKELLQNKTELGVIDAEFASLTILKNNFEELVKKKGQLTLLMERKPLMDQLASEIASFEKTEKGFKALLNRFNSNKIALENSKKQYVSFTDQKDKIVKIIDENQTKIVLLQPLFDNLENTKNKVSDLESIEKIKGFKTDLIVVDEKIKKADTLYVEAEKKEQELKTDLVDIQKELITIKTKRMDANLLVEIGNWYNVQGNHSVKLAEIIQKSTQVQNEIDKQKELFSASNLPFENWKEVVASKREVLLLQKKELQTVQTKLMVSKELAHFADNLHEGENCPLCGALEHPNVMQAEDVSERLQTNKLALSVVEEQEVELAKIALIAEKFELSFALLKSQLETFNSEKLATETTIQTHLSKFVWTDFNANDMTVFNSKKREQIEVENGIKAIEDKEKAFRLLKETKEAELKLQLNNRGILVAEQASKSGAITNELTQLKKLLFSDYDAIPLASVQAEIAELNQENIRIALCFEGNIEFKKNVYSKSFAH
ncbi:AAA family ATPase [Flavobacterium sp. TMP13]|uniref:AAA family ATPase n=1 Tax=Flavobacterium sp. TMP13 TaxID=3425950 RepID=UPI003D77CBC8